MSFAQFFSKVPGKVGHLSRMTVAVGQKKGPAQAKTPIRMVVPILAIVCGALVAIAKRSR
jgi:hypothetical protein